MKKRVLRVVGEGIVIVLISFAFGEAVLRVIDHYRPSHIFYDESYRRFRRPPFKYYYDFRLNSRGFHDIEFPEDKGGAFRIVALGDSFAFGMVPYQHNYLTLLEEQLDSAERPVEVLNMGIPSTCPRDHVHLLLSEGLDLEPDLVLGSFYVGNDLIETHEQLEEKTRLVDRSHVLSLLRYAFFIWPRIPDQIPPANAGGERPKRLRVYQDEKPTFSEREHMWIESRRAKVFTTDWEALQSSTEMACRDLSTMQDLSRSRGAEFFVAVLPDEKQVDPSLQLALARRSEEFAPENVDYDQPTRMLIECLEKRGIRYVDLLPAFREAGRREDLYRPRDTHWNIAGNRLAAHLIADALREEIRD